MSSKRRARRLTSLEIALYPSAIVAAESVGRRVLTLRKAAGISQAELGRFLQIHQSALSRVEGGGQQLSPAQLLALSKLFHIPLEQLLAGVISEVREEHASPQDRVGESGRRDVLRRPDTSETCRGLPRVQAAPPGRAKRRSAGSS